MRSLVIIIAVALGLFAGAFLLAFSWGLNQERARSIVETKTSHIQLHTQTYLDDPRVGDLIPSGEAVLTAIAQQPEVKAATGRLLTNGMISTASGGFGVMIQGVTAKTEAAVTHLSDRIIAGTYFSGKRKNQLLVGKPLAKKLGLMTASDTGMVYNLRKRLVLTFLDQDGQTQAARFRVVGVYQGTNSKLDERNVFIQRKDLNRLLGTNQALHEIAVILDDQGIAEDPTFLGNLHADHPQLAIQNWKDLSPDLKLLDEGFRTSIIIFMTIILLALGFGIVNTMLMAILERTRELGMLMSIGMNKIRVFSMIMLETVMLTLVGAPFGLLLAYGIISYFGQVGIDISAFAEGGASMGIGSRAYTALEPDAYQLIAVLVIITAIIAAIFPAIRALRLKPAEAVRAI